MKKICDSILDAIGETPMVRINTITRGLVSATVLAKVETFNPGNSIKDRMALRMIEDAERAGLLKPGGTIIEGTSGNTGMGLAIAAVIKGYKCIFTTTDKQSKEKIDALKAFGADVIVCPTNVDPEDPRSYYSVSSRLERDVPNSWKANQYDNLSNSAAHYEQTGPEIWEQTGGRVTGDCDRARRMGALQHARGWWRGIRGSLHAGVLAGDRASGRRLDSLRTSADAWTHIDWSNPSHTAFRRHRQALYIAAH